MLGVPCITSAIIVACAAVSAHGSFAFPSERGRLLCCPLSPAHCFGLFPWPKVHLAAVAVTAAVPPSLPPCQAATVLKAAGQRGQETYAVAQHWARASRHLPGVLVAALCHCRRKQKVLPHFPLWRLSPSCVLFPLPLPPPWLFSFPSSLFCVHLSCLTPSFSLWPVQSSSLCRCGTWSLHSGLKWQE